MSRRAEREARSSARSGRLRLLGARGTQVLLGGLVISVAGSLAVSAATRQGESPSVFAPTFPAERRLMTNEVAFFDPRAGAPVDHTWIVTSGSLFSDAGTGWTGPVDAGTPDPQSKVHTNSAILRVVTRRKDFQNVRVAFDLDVAGLTSTRATPRQAYDGVHVFLRYSSAQQLYAASVVRRDGTVAIKKKVPGGPSNGGEYATLASVKHAVPLRRWNSIVVTSVNTSQGVRITVGVNGRTVVQAVDLGTLGRPITVPGQVGLRGDNASFHFRAFTVTKL